MISTKSLFSNMIGAAKASSSVYAMSVSKLLKKFLGPHHMKFFDHIEDNYNFNINRTVDTQVSKSLRQIISMNHKNIKEVFLKLWAYAQLKSP